MKMYIKNICSNSHLQIHASNEQEVSELQSISETLTLHDIAYSINKGEFHYHLNVLLTKDK